MAMSVDAEGPIIRAISAFSLPQNAITKYMRSANTTLFTESDTLQNVIRD